MRLGHRVDPLRPLERRENNYAFLQRPFAKLFADVAVASFVLVVVSSLPTACALDILSRFVAALSVWLRWAHPSMI